MFIRIKRCIITILKKYSKKSKNMNLLVDPQAHIMYKSDEGRHNEEIVWAKPLKSGDAKP